MSGTKEIELWDTCRQERINDYRTQSAALTGLYDCQRFGCRRECLDLILQRPNDKPISIASGRDTGVIEWFEAMDNLIVKLRLTVGTDVIGMLEWFEFAGYDFVTEDRGRSNAVLNMERYAAVISNDDGIGEGVGATEAEALAYAVIQLQEIANARRLITTASA